MLSQRIRRKDVLRVAAKGSWITLTFIVVIGFIVVLQGCPGETKALKGFGLSPQGFPLDWGKLGNFYTEVAAMANSAAM